MHFHHPSLKKPFLVISVSMHCFIQSHEVCLLFHVSHGIAYEVCYISQLEFFNMTEVTWLVQTAEFGIYTHFVVRS